MERGYVKLWRKTLESGLLQHPTVCQLFFYLLLKATHKPRKQFVSGTVFDLRPGDAIIGRAKIAAELNMTEKQARTALEALKKLGVVAARGANKCTVVSLVNWNRYQQSTSPEGPAEEPAEEPGGGRTGAGSGPFEGHKQECKNTRSKNRKTDASHLARSPAGAESAPPPEARPVVTLPLNTGEEYPVSRDDAGEYTELYPAVNVPQALRDMRGWLLADPKRRKTRSGIRRFVNSWLAREQNRGGAPRASPPANVVKSWQERESESNLQQFLES